MDINSTPLVNTMGSKPEFVDTYLNLDETQDFLPELVSMPNMSGRSTLEFSTVRHTTPQSVPTSPYLPHLAIYDHLPKNTDIFSDISKYQRWATMVLPRIASPRNMINRKGFAVRLSKDRYDDSPISPDVITMSQTGRKREKKEVTEKSFTPRRKKVRPGLARGNTTKHKTCIEANQHVDGQTIARAKTKLTGTPSEPRSHRSASTSSTALGVAFQKMTVLSPDEDQNLVQEKSSCITRITQNGDTRQSSENHLQLKNDPQTAKQQKQYISFTHPANLRPIKPQHSFVSSSVRDNKQFQDNQQRQSFLRHGNRTTSCLNITLNNWKKEKTIPSFNDLNKSFSEDLGQCVTAGQVPS